MQLDEEQHDVVPCRIGLTAASIQREASSATSRWGVSGVRGIVTASLLAAPSPRQRNRPARSVSQRGGTAMAKKTVAKTTVRFTVTCKTNDSLSGMVQTEDQDEKEQRVLLDGAGVGSMKLPPGSYTFVWAVKMSPVAVHHYGIKAERVPDDGSPPVPLRSRPQERTTSGGEDVGFDVFELP
jgi:hypothetical protein